MSRHVLAGATMRLASTRLALALLAAALAAPALGAAPGATRLAPGPLAALRAREPARAALARSTLLDARPRLGLAADAGFEPRAVFTDDEGRTVARFRQTFRGHRVLAGEAVVHVERDGAVRTHARGLKLGVEPEGEPRLTAEDAITAALRRLAPRGPLARPATAELIVFPSRLTGGVVTRRDPITGRLAVDRELSVSARPPADPGVWAWEVETLLVNRRDGHKELSYVVDARTGAILRVTSGLQRATPTTGQGHSFYRGEVPVSTLQADDGTFTLVSKAHGTLPNPFVAEQGVDWTGLTTAYSWFHTDTGVVEFDAYAGHATNAWGNGEALPYPIDPDSWQVALDTSGDGLKAWMKGALDPVGETAAVDAHTGLTATWDFYRSVYGRDGIDGHGTSTFAVVHAIVNGFFMSDNAFWSNGMFAMMFGDGTAGTLFAQPWSMTAITELDVTGHELTHGVTFSTAALEYVGESGGLNEATSDIFGKMVQAWVAGGATGATVPDFADGDLAAWAVGAESVSDGQPPLRYMHQPSKDGISVDEWFDGVEQLDVHFSSGIGNRFFYFLAEGASADAGSESHSTYLPGGMAGIGNEKAARIWYRALTEYLVPDDDYEAAREASLDAAADLHGAGSPEHDAVARAWAAVNVGAAPGEPAPIRVRLPVMHPPGTFLYDNAVPEGVLERVQLFPTRTRVHISTTVENTDDERVRIESPVDAFSSAWEVGHVEEDGSWTTPWFSYYSDLIQVLVRSDADPRQYAKGSMLLVELDGNTDGEMDVFDLAATAMEWGLPQTLHQPVAPSGGSSVDDWDLVFWTEAFQAGYPAR